MKKFRVLLLILFILPCALMFTACKEDRELVRVKKISSEDGTTLFKAEYSNGEFSTFELENTEDNLTIEKIYEAYVSNGGELDFFNFLKEYLSVSYENTPTEFVLNNVLKSVVAVFGKSNAEDGVFCGSGVIYEMDDDYTYILTNHHVLTDEQNNVLNTVCAYLYGHPASFTNDNSLISNDVSFGGDAIKCDYLASSRVYDLGIIRCSTAEIKRQNPDAKAVDIADAYHVGEEAVAAGNPDGDGLSVTKGIVSVDSEKINIKTDGVSEQFRVMRIDTSVNPGNSGGGLFNSKGELIGIVNAKRADYIEENEVVTFENMAYALPIDNVAKVAESLIFYGKKGEIHAKRLNLGITAVAANSKAVFETAPEIVEDVQISQITNGLLGARMGLQRGDIVLSMKLNGEKINFTRSFQIVDEMFAIRANDVVQFTVKRGSNTLELQSHKVSASELLEVL